MAIAKLFIATALAALCLLLAFGTTDAAARDYKPLRNFSVPVGGEFPLDGLTDASGRVIAKEQWLGKPLLINFYTRHCAPCVKEVPVLNHLRRLRDDLHVLALTPDGREEAANYAKQHGLTWPVAAGAESLVFERLGVKTFPAFALLDAQGRLLATTYGNQLGGEEGYATVAGIVMWVDRHLGGAAK